MTINIEGTKLFIDGSYYIFYRYFATNMWYKNQGIDDPEQFFDKYKQMFEKVLINLIKQYNVPWENVIFAKDCTREKIWRNDITDNYKATRNSKIDANIFQRTYEEIIPAICAKYSMQIISHPRLEADDVIALTIKELQKRSSSDNKYIIITNDNDYVQIGSPFITIKNLQNIDIMERNSCTNPQEFLKAKIIQGDKSDNISSIWPKCGPKTALKLAKDHEALENFFAKHAGSETIFNKNRILIDFNFIDETYKKEYLESIAFT